MESKQNTEILARIAADALSDLKGVDIELLDLSSVSSFADYFVIASGDSHVHMRALADRARETLAQHGEKIDHTEGRDSQNWILLDFGSLIVHILSKQARDFYALEQLWGDAQAVVWQRNENGAVHVAPSG